MERDINQMEKFVTQLSNSRNSKTVRFFALMAVLAALFDYLQYNVLALQSVLEADVYKALLTFVIAGGVVLRFFTSQCLSDKGKKKDEGEA